MDTTHSRMVFDQWQLEQGRLSTEEPVTITGNDLELGNVINVACRGTPFRLSDDYKVRSRVENSVDYLELQLAKGRIIYGVNTGFGGSADARTHKLERLQSAAIQHLNVGILLEMDKNRVDKFANKLLRSHALPPPIVRAAMLIRCNSLLRGHSGVRFSIIESIARLAAHDMTPMVPLRGSISASGDLSTLSYIAGAIEGNPDVYLELPGGEVAPASEVLSAQGWEPVRFQAKEGLGITNGTAPSCAAACLALYEANRLAFLAQVLTAMGTEALDGTAHNYHPFISITRPHAGQSEAAANILRFLKHSKLSKDRGPDRAGLAQDRYALRTAPQWIGPQLEDLLLATRQIATELNSTTDNPLIDVANDRIHHGGNFQAAAVTSAMEKTMVALQNLGRLLFAQCSELINNATSNGLPPNLCFDDPSESFTFKGFDVNMAAYMAELAYLAHPMSTHVQVAEMANQSVNSMALAMARYVLEAVEVLSMMAATYIYALCQAVQLRVLQKLFHQTIPSLIREACFSYFGGSGATASPPGLSAPVEELITAISKRWDELAHVDHSSRCFIVVRDCLGRFVDNIASVPGCSQVTVPQLKEFQSKLSFELDACGNTLKARVRDEKNLCEEYLAPVTAVLYRYVRRGLGIPLNQGVSDHPPLVLREMIENKNSKRCEGSKEAKIGDISKISIGGEKTEMDNAEDSNMNSDTSRACVSETSPGCSNDSRLLVMGSQASKIYEAIRAGVLVDKVMEYCAAEGFWD
ncbi:putative phenylalanine ammonia-lyase [Echria macrotheca]|uniref:Phenylalanine ammonia-lyase n=1 Tax=Echria macrotheca TaxID=438768 RepID=A0AAJ0FGQ8_9PEZI|nr:putative phenylalanine ammonia-lyase [Echria macrotheca]